MSDHHTPWAVWISALPQHQRDRVFTLAASILPQLVTPAHTRVDTERDDAAISTALRIAQRFYARTDLFKRKLCICGDPSCTVYAEASDE